MTPILTSGSVSLASTSLALVMVQKKSTPMMNSGTTVYIVSIGML